MQDGLQEEKCGTQNCSTCFCIFARSTAVQYSAGFRHKARGKDSMHNNMIYIAMSCSP